MPRVAIVPVLAAISLSGSLAGACKSEKQAPFYEPTARDSGTSGAPGGGRHDGGEPSSPARAGCDDGPELHALFIGNSHTYTNDLPALVRDLACAAGTRVVSQQVTPGGVGFVEHAASAETLDKIKADEWDVVVMQDQQQRPGYRLEEVESDHLPAARMLVDAIREHRKKTRPLFYMIWSRRDGDDQNCEYYPLLCTFEGSTQAIADGYRLYAERTRSELAPVALAWAAVLADEQAKVSGDELWMDDGSHPAPAGSYLAAAVLVATMLDIETAELAYDAALTKSAAAYLRGIADRVVREQRADVRVATAERVRIRCGYSGVCSDAADAAPVTFSLFSESCKELAAGTARVRATIDTHLSCRSGQCQSVWLGAWHHVRGGTIVDGTYHVHAHVDVNANGKLDKGDLEACDGESLSVGGGEDLAFLELDAR